jgi:hypothetical protein
LKKLTAAVLLALVAVSGQLPLRASAASCNIPANPFILTSVVWGTPGSPIQVQPGDSGVPLTASLLYTGCTTALYGSFSVPLPPGFTPANPQAGTTVYLQNIAPFSTSEVTFNLNLAASPQITIGSWFSSTLQVTFTVDGANYNVASVPIKDQVLGRANLLFSASPQSLVAGQVNSLALTIRNRGTGSASQVSTSVTVAITTVGQPFVSILGSIPDVSTIAAASNFTTILSVFVPSSDAGQAFALQLASTYVDPYSITRTATQSVYLYSMSAPAANLELTPSANDLTAGSVTTVIFTLRNTGSGAADNITISAAPSQLLSVLNLPPRIVSLASSSQTSFPLQLFAGSAAAGSALGIEFTVTYQDSYGNTKTFTQNVGFYSPSFGQQANSPLSITVQPNVLLVGETNNLAIFIKNTGNSTLGSLIVSFSSPSGTFTWLNPNQAQVASLAPGANFTVKGSLFDPVQAPASTTLQLSVTYYQGKVQVLETRSIGLLSRGAIDVSLTSLTILPQSATAGNVVSLTLTLTNIGVISAAGVTASFVFPQGFKVVGSSSDFIGAMLVDSPSTITVSALVANGTAPGSYTIPVKLTYVDNLRNQLSQNLSVTVTVVSAAQAGKGTTQQSGSSNGIGAGLIPDIAIVAAVVIVAFLVVRRMRRPESIS